MRLKDCGRSHNLAGCDGVHQSRRIDRIEFHLLRLELAHHFFAFGFDHGTDDLVARLADADAHLALQRRMKETVEMFRHGVFGYERFVIGETDVGFARKSPVNEILLGALLAVFRILVQVR